MSAFDPSATRQAAAGSSSQSRSSRAAATSMFYFAYGSNLHLAQMAQRCPGSVFLGKATLDSYRWQINQRGVANVVRSGPEHSVQGLLYSVGPRDEKTLDRSEGVSKGFYQKQLQRVTFQPHEKFENFKAARVSHLIGGEKTSKATGGRAALVDDAPDGASSSRDVLQTHEVKALVYVSERYTDDGPIREEYIARMQNAVNDAASLGVSRAFLDTYIVPFLDTVQSSPAVRATANAVARSRSDQADTDAEMKDSASRRVPPQDQPTADTAGQAGYIDLSEVRKENRESGGDSEVTFPAELFKSLAKIDTTVERVDAGNIYIVVTKQIAPGTDTDFRILAAAQGIQLANELALKKYREMCTLKHYREMCALSSEAMREEGEEPHAVLDREANLGKLTWNLGNDSCLFLSTKGQGVVPWLAVWVEPQVLLGC